MTGKKRCSKCDLNAADRGGIEVEYKDFKTSELLEIRQKGPTAPSGEKTKIVGKQLGEKDITRKDTAKLPLADKKNSFFFLGVAALALMMITLVFFLVRYLFHR
jgi:hypothetical protein